MSSRKVTRRPACCGERLQQSFAYYVTGSEEGASVSGPPSMPQAMSAIPIRPGIAQGIPLRGLDGNLLPPLSPRQRSPPQQLTDSYFSSDESAESYDSTTSSDCSHDAPRARITQGIPLRDLKGNPLAPLSPRRRSPPQLTASSFCSDESAEFYDDSTRSDCCSQFNSFTIGSMSMIKRVREPECDLLHSTMLYPLSSTIRSMMGEATDESADDTLTLIVEEEKDTLASESRVPLAERKTLRRQDGMVRLPGVL